MLTCHGRFFNSHLAHIVYLTKLHTQSLLKNKKKIREFWKKGREITWRAILCRQWGKITRNKAYVLRMFIREIKPSNFNQHHENLTPNSLNSQFIEISLNSRIRITLFFSWKNNYLMALVLNNMVTYTKIHFRLRLLKE